MEDNKTESQHNASKERDLHEEANRIKAQLAEQKKEESSPTKVKDHEIEFTSIIETAIDGLNPVKIRPSVIHNYVPDFFFVGHLTVRMFETLRNDKSIKKNEDIDPFGFLLYVYYALMYTVLRVYNNLGVTDPEAIYAQTMFENSGFSKAKLPMIFNNWVDGVGTFVDDVFGKHFEPKLPPIEITRTDHNQGFWSKNTAHLLPNFMAILNKLVFLSNEPRVTLQAHNRTLQNYRDATFAVPLLDPFPLTRTYDQRIPGVGFITRKHVSGELAALAYDALQIRYTNVYARYFNFSADLLNYLSIHYGEMLMKMDTFGIEKVSDKGTDLIVCILRELEEQDVLVEEIRMPNPDKDGGKGKKPTSSKDGNSDEGCEGHKIMCPRVFAHNSRVFTKSKKVNGTAIIASVSPLIRLAVEENRIPFEDYEFESPYHHWYDHSYEHHTEKFTLEESHAKFVKRRV